MKKNERLHKCFQEEEQTLYEAITSFQNGNKDKATLIYQMSKQYSYNIIFRQISKFIDQNIISGDAKLIVEDIMQELYMEFFRTISQFRNEEPKSFYKWVTVVANRMVLRYVDKNKMEVLQKEQWHEYGEEYDVKEISELSDDENNLEFVPDSALEKKEFQKIMKKFIEQLPEAQAQTIIYHIYGGLKYQEIADLMGVSLITVKTRMRKAKDSLKERVLEYEKKTGTQINGLAPIPLIGFFLRVYIETSKIPISIDFRLLNEIQNYIDESTPVLVGYIESFFEAIGIKEIITGVVVAAVVSTGTVGVIRNLSIQYPETKSVVEEQQQEETEQQESEQDSTKNDVAPGEVIQQSSTKTKYFLYWDSKSIDVTSYVHEGDYYQDPTYGTIKKWLVCEDALLEMPFTKKVVSGKNVYCYDDGTYQYEFVINGTNSYTINGSPYTYDMEVETIDGKMYINPYHLFNNMFGMTGFIVGGSSGGSFVGITTTQSGQSTSGTSSSQETSGNTSTDENSGTGDTGSSSESTGNTGNSSNSTGSGSGSSSTTTVTKGTKQNPYKMGEKIVITDDIVYDPSRYDSTDIFHLELTVTDYIPMEEALANRGVEYSSNISLEVARATIKIIGEDIDPYEHTPITLMLKKSNGYTYSTSGFLTSVDTGFMREVYNNTEYNIKINATYATEDTVWSYFVISYYTSDGSSHLVYVKLE